jgi:hypothetical protein
MSTSRLIPPFLLALASLTLPVTADPAWTIPGIVHADGLNGTHFVSDLTLTNPGTAPANVTVSFFPGGTSAAKNLTLAPGQTVVFADVAGVTFGISGGAGALSISSDQPLLIRAKTYNSAASGTYGVALPVVASDRLLASGDFADSLWITQDASGATGYRTNIALVFPDASGGAATVTVYDADGNVRGSQNFGLATAGLQQFSVGSFAGGVPVGRAQVAVTRGHASAYAVVVDNVTGDSSLFSFEDLPAGIQDVLVNGVARANGRNGAFFRTDGRFYNPTDTDATVQVSFHANQSANAAPQTASFVLPAGKIRDVVDVLDSLLQLPIGSAGALRFRSNWPVAILCRTSNVDPSGARPGTFGSQEKPVPLLSFLTSADAGAAITGIRQDTAFRTNVGFAAGAEGASYTLALQNAAGTTVATTSASLGAFGWTQPGIQDLFPTITIPQNASLSVKVTAGSVDVFDSSIDNLSGDPVVTPVTSLPVAIPSSTTIGPAGGSIRSDDGRLTLRVPAGALSQPVALSVQTATNDAPNAVGSGYQILPSGTAFAKKALLTLAYGRDDTDGANGEALTVVVSSASGWFALGGGSIDPVRRLLTVRLSSTAPSPPASAASGPRASRSLASPSGVLGITTNWRIDPRRPVAIVTDSSVPLSVSYIGPSSSTDPDETYLLPTKPADVQVSWIVNDGSGNTTNGAVVSNGSTTGTYIAPSCPPPRNPVVIKADISRAGIVALPYRVAGAVTVRLIPRDWLLDWIVEATLECGNDIAEITRVMASDRISWTGPATTIAFSLSTNLTCINPNYQIVAPPSHSFVACRCYGTNPTIASYGTDGPLEVPFGAVWDVDNDRMHLILSSLYAYEGGVVMCTPQGTSPIINGDLVQGWAFDLPLDLRSGERGSASPSGRSGPWTFSVQYYLRPANCP